VSPTLRLWQLAESLRNYRDRANLTIEKAGTLLKPYSQRWSRSKVQRIETRLYAPTPAEVEHMVDVYNVPATEAAVLTEIAREARQKGWWQASAFPKHFQSFVGAWSRPPPRSGLSSSHSCPACCRPPTTLAC
jgi:hypothetical protein